MSYLAIVDSIMERLRATCPSVKRVEELADIQDLLEYSQVAPALLVYYDGDDVPSGATASAGRGAAQIVMQRIIVTVVARSSQGQAGQTGVRRAAGEIINEVLAALPGWQPTPAHRPLHRVTAPRPEYMPGVGFIPLAFNAQRVTVSA